MSLLDTLLTLYMYQNNKNSSPNITQVPPTQGEQLLLNSFQNALAHPSAQRQAAGQAASQFLNQVGSMAPQNFSFISPLMKGQQFAGGMTMPKFSIPAMDFSKGIGSGAPDTTGTGNSMPSVPAGTATGNGPTGFAPDGSPVGFYGTPAAPGYSGSDVPVTGGQDILNWLGNHSGGITTLLGLLGVPASMQQAFTNWLAGHQTLPPGNVSVNPGMLAPGGGNEASWGSTAGNQMGDLANSLIGANGGGSDEPPQSLPTQTPMVPNLTPKT